MSDSWKFDDAPNTACFTTSFILDGAPILRVCHDYDGDWQFHGPDTDSVSDEDCRIVCLKEMVDRDPAVVELHDLPYGWSAERPDSSTDWQRFIDHPFPTFDENGYYLEDAVWLSDYMSDINPPPADVRENLTTGDYVKLIFRFAAEAAERKDLECEWMWVRVIETEEDGNYVGVLDNQPNHDAARLGDAMHFHPLHVAAIDGGE